MATANWGELACGRALMWQTGNTSGLYLDGCLVSVLFKEPDLNVRAALNTAVWMVMEI